MKDIINEVKQSKEIYFKKPLICMLYATYFVGYSIGYLKRKIKEIKKCNL